MFKRGIELQRGPHNHHHQLRDLKIALAAELGRSKFAASPLDPKPQSLIGCDREPADVVLGIRAQLLKEIGNHK
ncbi:hypothetical protein QIH85_43020 [Bradyrhizobium japonicum]|uniref:hypothetical protein n=1 Tax=Bradyrhizobium japonicum TaxID=375 RepID=UPI001E3726F7|nr:hypothetical protein [Bradyrhizobium japonicum]MCD9898136.1 hypothetical protein [Bradyrhizobium japonicum]WLB28505.1 hypothetical protein QIH85_43020 [Bradyrhizobium japonicum]WRJ84741.1 hypothetical protein R3F78_07635 [Bradyrhizobium japonicum]WRJ93711.1 hypothetical protein R3F77_05345 [Bradyrhizobium japonicum]WRK47563.1 hypothetical protein R3F73_05405 [Bradyrhizobium japonicum]